MQLLFRISGKYAISIFSPMAMPRESKMDQPGVSLANTELENVKEILLKLALLNYTIFILKLSHSLSVSKVILLTGQDQDKNVPHNSILIGTKFTLAPQELKEINGTLIWVLQLINLIPHILMSHGLLLMELIQAAMNQLFFQTWLNLYAQFIKVLKKLMPANDLSINYLRLI